MNNDTSTNDALKARMIAFRRRLYLEHDLGAVDDYIHPQFRSHNALVEPGRAGYRAFAAHFHAGLPDLTPDFRHVLAEGDKVVTFIHWQATHTGPFRGIPATGKSLVFETADLFRAQDGLFIEHWDIVDRLPVAQTLGMFRQPAAPS